MKKLLLTIIILGACLVGSSQNWDSVKVGNVDVDSIMMGGAKIWEKQNTDTTYWTYEGVMTVGYFEQYCTEIFGYVPGIPAGGMLPENDNIEQIAYVYDCFDFPDSSLCLVISNAEITGQMKILINESEFIIPYYEPFEGWKLDIGDNNPFPPVGETCEIKLRYTLAP